MSKQVPIHLTMIDMRRLAAEYCEDICEFLGDRAYEHMCEESDSYVHDLTHGYSIDTAHDFCDANQFAIDVLERNGYPFPMSAMVEEGRCSVDYQESWFQLSGRVMNIAQAFNYDAVAIRRISDEFAV